MKRLLLSSLLSLSLLFIFSFGSVAHAATTEQGNGAYNCTSSNCYSNGVVSINGAKPVPYREQATFPLAGACSGTITPINALGVVSFSGEMVGSDCVGSDSFGNAFDQALSNGGGTAHGDTSFSA